LGTTVTTAGTTSIFASTADVGFDNSSVSTTNTAGKLFRAQICNGIDSVPVLDVDTSVITSGAATSFTALTGQTVTINRSTSGRKTVCVVNPLWLFGTDDYMEVNNRYMSSGTYLYLPGVASNYASTPDAAPLDITGDIDIRCKVALDDWTPAAAQVFLAKRATNQYSYQFSVQTNGVLNLSWTPDGINAISKNSTVAPTVSDGSTLWIRVTLDVDNGASGNDVIFYTSTDGTNWTQLGTTVTTAGTTSVHSGTAVLEVGTTLGGANNPARGKFFRAQVLNGIGGTVAFDANFETSITSLLQDTFTESSANSATVTINRSGSAYRSAGITRAGYLIPGGTNTFQASGTDLLNFGASDSFTIFVAERDWGSQVSGAGDGVLGKKLASATSGVGYMLRNWSSQVGGTDTYISDGTTQVNSYTPSGNVAGAFLSATMVRNVTTDQLLAYSNATQSYTGSNSPRTDTTTGSLSDIIATFRIGLAVSLYLDGEIYAVALWRRALTDAEITSINSYYLGRYGA